MTRIKRGKITTRTRKKIIKNTRGFKGAWSTLLRPMKQSSLRALNFSYKHRRKRSRLFRRSSILRINALIKSCGLSISYNHLICSLRSYNCELNRNILMNIGLRDQHSFLYFIRAICSSNSYYKH
jgi:large subunit ribosomal protein L20